MPLQEVRLAILTLGSVGVASLGCVTSDSKGNILLATKAANGKSFSIYKTSSVTTAPTLLTSYTNNTSLDMGTKYLYRAISIQMPLLLLRVTEQPRPVLIRLFAGL